MKIDELKNNISSPWMLRLAYLLQSLKNFLFLFLIFDEDLCLGVEKNEDLLIMSSGSLSRVLFITCSYVTIVNNREGWKP